VEGRLWDYVATIPRLTYSSTGYVVVPLALPYLLTLETPNIKSSLGPFTVQRALRDKASTSRKIDGEYGLHTVAAVEAFPGDEPPGCGRHLRSSHREKTRHRMAGAFLAGGREVNHETSAVDDRAGRYSAHRLQYGRRGAREGPFIGRHSVFASDGERHRCRQHAAVDADSEGAGHQQAAPAGCGRRTRARAVRLEQLDADLVKTISLYATLKRSVNALEGLFSRRCRDLANGSQADATGEAVKIGGEPGQQLE
jgi:hypothetical protein